MRNHEQLIFVGAARALDGRGVHVGSLADLASRSLGPSDVVVVSANACDDDAIAALRARSPETTFVIVAASSTEMLAMGFAHEIANPLASVDWSLHAAQEAVSLGDVGVLGSALEAARDGVKQMCALVDDLRNATRNEPPRPVDVRVILDVSARIVAERVRPRARLVTAYDPVPLVAASETRLTQVFVNLLLNAAQSIAPDAAADDTITVTTRLDARGHVVVSVRDTGCGMTAEVAKRIFDPFFTTKRASGGSGIGLLICRHIIDSLDGVIEVDSAPGHGSEFRVTLPPAKSPT